MEQLLHTRHTDVDVDCAETLQLARRKRIENLVMKKQQIMAALRQQKNMDAAQQLTGVASVLSALRTKLAEIGNIENLGTSERPIMAELHQSRRMA
jgi:hypothetical protein